MKIAFLAYDLSENSGWGRYTVQILKMLAQEGVEPVIFTARGTAPNPSLKGMRHYPILRSYADGKYKVITTWIDFLAVRRKARDCRAFHCIVEPFMPLGALLAGKGRELFVTAHGTYAIRQLGSTWSWLYRWGFRKCSVVFAVSRYTQSRLASVFPEIAPKILAIPLGVEMASERSFPPAAARENAFMTVGEIKPRKGVLETVLALGKVVERHPHARYYIIGRVPSSGYVAKIKEAVERLGLAGNVIWKGRISQSELDALYAKVRGFVLPSMNLDEQFEGFGLVHLEANALGLPAIGSLECGNEDAIVDGESGFLVKQGDVEGLAAAMGKLLDPDFPWDRLSESAYRFAQSMDWNKPARRYAEIFSRGLSEASHPPHSS